MIIIMLIRRKNPLLYENLLVLHLNKLESPSLKDALWQVWLKLVQWFLRRRFFLILSMHFCYFVIISPWKRAGPFIWTNLGPLHPSVLCAYSSGELKNNRWCLLICFNVWRQTVYHRSSPHRSWILTTYT